jgi:excisionase family DNA binding protein
VANDLFQLERSPVPRLALRVSEAAAALGISRRLLQSLVQEGRVPHVRLGRRVVFPVTVLQAWLDSNITSNMEVRA